MIANLIFSSSSHVGFRDRHKRQRLAILFSLLQLLLTSAQGPSELKLQLTINTDKTIAELKQAIADKSDVPADRQRLIYSGTSILVPLFCR
jgi:hypothetical protein